MNASQYALQIRYRINAPKSVRTRRLRAGFSLFELRHSSPPAFILFGCVWDEFERISRGNGGTLERLVKLNTPRAVCLTQDP